MSNENNAAVQRIIELEETVADAWGVLKEFGFDPDGSRLSNRIRLAMKERDAAEARHADAIRIAKDEIRRVQKTEARADELETRNNDLQQQAEATMAGLKELADAGLITESRAAEIAGVRIKTLRACDATSHKEWRVRAYTAEARVAELEALINSPHTASFLEAVRIEAAHQRERWGEEHDKRKAPTDWLWTFGYMVNKAVHDVRGKRKHHIIAGAALLLNWHRLEGEADDA